MKKIIFTGPESTGKTTLAVALAKHFKAPYVAEMARDYIELLNRPYVFSDLEIIAQLQLQQEKKIAQENPKFLICDTDCITIKIWSIYKYKKCVTWLLNEIKKDTEVLYFLCDIDTKWENDTQRENPNDRELLLNLYEDELKKNKKEYIIISGSIEDRLYKIKSYLNEII